MNPIDFSTDYLGLRLNSPLVASASPCTGQPDVLQRLEEFGAGAAVLPSLFEEQIARAAKSTEVLEQLAEFPTLNYYNAGADNYVALINRVRSAVSMPVIASLNGVTLGGWLNHAKRIEDAGADALELNLYFVPTDSTQSATLVEAQYLDVIAAVRSQVELPLAVKIGPFFSSLPHFARQVVESGATDSYSSIGFLSPTLIWNILALSLTSN